MVFPDAPSNFSNTVPQQYLIAEEWVTCKDKKWSGFIFSNAFFSYKECRFIWSGTIIWQISVQSLLFGLEEGLLHFLTLKLVFITLERQTVWVKAYQCKSQQLPSPITSPPLQLNPLLPAFPPETWQPSCCAVGVMLAATTPLNLPVHLTDFFNSSLLHYLFRQYPPWGIYQWLEPPCLAVLW